jgi:hypothetical protein
MKAALGQEGHHLKRQYQNYPGCRRSWIDVFHNTRDVLFDTAMDLPL